MEVSEASTADATGGSVASSTDGTPSASTSSSAVTSDATTGGGCGDGQLADAEECDDNNQVAGDGCANCLKEFRRVFITSQVFTGNLGGLAGADQKCQDAADSAGLPGLYKAWLSVASESPTERFVHSPVPYRQVDGVEVASDWTDLVDGNIEAGIFVSELNGPPGKGVHSCLPMEIVPVWTGTGESGMMIPGDYFCDNWNSLSGQGFSGRAGSTDSQWTQFCTATCQDQAALYCVEQ